MNPERLKRILILTIVFAGTCAILSGCYKRVTRASGFGASQYEVAEPYQSNSPIDDLIYGKQEKGDDRAGSRLK